MKVMLPSALEEFVSSQVSSGEFKNASAVVGEALRLLRDAQEQRALEAMRSSFAAVDSSGSVETEPTSKERVLIGKLIRGHRSARQAR
jgi:putative addiction module CopG family antidote